MEPDQNKTIQKAIKNKYGEIARGTSGGCGCTSVSCCGGENETLPEVTVQLSTQLGYSEQALKSVPESANLNLGCGNPQAIADLKGGETVLDLGCGAGFDSFLAARQVGAQGKVIGVDMTMDMVRKACENARTGHYPQVIFHCGEIEHLPIPGESVDVIISNCVINLSTDKHQVFREAYRVLKTGGRLAISDVVATAELPEAVRNDLEMVSACIGGAMEIKQLNNLLMEIGFKAIHITSHNKSREILHEWAPEYHPEDFIQSSGITATK